MTTYVNADHLVIAPAVVTVVESSGCHFCADAEEVLGQLAHDFDLTIQRVDARSTEGMALMQENGAAMSPLVLLDGQYVSSGRLPRGKVRKMLEARLARLEGSQK